MSGGTRRVILSRSYPAERAGKTYRFAAFLAAGFFADFFFAAGFLADFVVFFLAAISFGSSITGVQTFCPTIPSDARTGNAAFTPLHRRRKNRHRQSPPHQRRTLHCLLCDRDCPLRVDKLQIATGLTCWIRQLGDYFVKARWETSVVFSACSEVAEKTEGTEFKVPGSKFHACGSKPPFNFELVLH